MQYLQIVDMLNGSAYLRNDVQYFVLFEVGSGVAFLEPLPPCFNLFLQVSIFRVLHHDTEFACFGFVYFLKCNDVGVVEHLEELCFFESIRFLLCGHLANVDLLQHMQLSR